MCVYCDEYGEHNKLFQSTINLGYFGKVYVSGDITKNIIDNGAYLSIDLDRPNEGHFMGIGGKKINYCPICGRKL